VYTLHVSRPRRQYSVSVDDGTTGTAVWTDWLIATENQSTKQYLAGERHSTESAA